MPIDLETYSHELTLSQNVFFFFFIIITYCERHTRANRSFILAADASVVIIIRHRFTLYGRRTGRRASAAAVDTRSRGGGNYCYPHRVIRNKRVVDGRRVKKEKKNDRQTGSEDNVKNAFFFIYYSV